MDSPLQYPEPIEAPSADQIEEMIPRHAPPGWEQKFHAYGRLAERIQEGSQFTFIVLAADIRNSTLLQKEAVNFQLHAAILTRFVQAAGEMIRDIGGGWFDKFTGDGFLGYWVLGVALEDGGTPPLVVAAEDDAPSAWAAVQSALNCALVVHLFFSGQVLPDFRANSQNMAAGTGLAIGIDAGPAHFATVANELTILGAPVVGAVRMVTAAHAGEVVANVQFGELLARRHEREPIPALQAVRRELRESKEFPKGQEMYVLEFDPAQLDALWTQRH